jgi:AcrR family transcriptional regulator
MSPRHDVSEERRTQIIESAMKVFTRQGFTNTRMEDVAAESGLSKGLLYWYFKSKDEIIITLADIIFGLEFRKMEKLSIEDLPARDYLEKFLDIFLVDLRELLKVAPVMYEFYALAFRNKTIQKVMLGYLDRLIAILIPVVQHGMDNGEFRSGDPQQVAIAISAALEGSILLWAFAPDMVQPENQLRVSMMLLLDGLEAKKGTAHEQS